MKKSFLPLVIIVFLLIVGGVYFLSTSKNNSQSGTQGRDMNAMKGPVIQSHRSYSLDLLSPKSFSPNKSTPINYKIVDEQGSILRDFAIDHTKLMHFIVVRSDLQDFQHLHPDFNKNTGEFSVPLIFSADGNYRLYADFTPANGQKDSQGNPLSVTSPKDISVGNIGKYVPVPVMPETQTVKNVDGYKITYSIPNIRAGEPTTITLSVNKDGKPVSDMEEYLGAQAHGILISQEDMGFAHLHAMAPGMTHAMGGQSMTTEGTMSHGPEIKFDYTFPTSGIYKLFTQFQHQGKVITSPYVIVVK